VRPDYGPHFLISTEAEAATGAGSVQLDGIHGFAAWDTGAHGLGAEDLAALHYAATGRPGDLSILDGFQTVFARDEMHGPWLVRLPNEFVSALATLDGEQLGSIGERWLQASENFRYRRAPGEWVQVVGFHLAQLAKRAVQENKGLYWEPQSC
jgi:hypothetical protein